MGNHSRTKLVPALVANGQQLAGVVSRSYSESDIPVFADLEDALKAFGTDTAFIVSSPPALHARQAGMILERGHDLFLEKPAFISRKEAVLMTELAAHRSVLLVDMMMCRDSALYQALIALYAARKGNVRAVRMHFLLDKMPLNTFRGSADLAGSSMFDIGCYPLALLADLGLGGAALQVCDVAFPGDRGREKITVRGQCENIELEFQVGVGTTYQNLVEIDFSGGERAVYRPVFYGRAGVGTVTIGRPGAPEIREIPLENAFEVMLRRPRAAWAATQAARSAALIQLTEKIEKFSKDAHFFAAQ
jgi:hypothetical protein